MEEIEMLSTELMVLVVVLIAVAIFLLRQRMRMLRDFGWMFLGAAGVILVLWSGFIWTMLGWILIIITILYGFRLMIFGRGGR